MNRVIDLYEPNRRRRHPDDMMLLCCLVWRERFENSPGPQQANKLMSILFPPESRMEICRLICRIGKRGNEFPGPFSTGFKVKPYHSQLISPNRLPTSFER